MRIAEVMTGDVAVVRPQDSVRYAAQRMDELNIGSLPVCDGKRLVGVITDRDITVASRPPGSTPRTPRSLTPCPRMCAGVGRMMTSRRCRS